MMEGLLNPQVFMVFKVVVVFIVVLTIVAIATWAERRGAAFIQDRVGPNRVALFGKIRILGLGQPLADGLKLFFKEDLFPLHVDRVLYTIAPIISFIPATMTFAAIPFGKPFVKNGTQYFLSILPPDTNIGVLYIFALAGMGVYGIIIGGWASNNKWSILGAMRASAQVISYELAMTLAVVGVILSTGSLRLDKIIEAQTGMWNIVPQILGAIVFFTAMFAETNRLPFDFAEGESEIIGYHTEYMSMKFSMFFLAEYANMITASGFFVVLYLGGWHFPYLDSTVAGSIIAFVIKLLFVLWTFIWIRWTLPRFRYDQLMRLGWKYLLPLSLINLVIVALFYAYGG
ncbi:NADH-quinone oxidoreductase subunit H [Thermotomaculum hydrothermale]|uniref:NADH-quinone oxidoreductase subunit H n=1 Tax=Thermotomaculum hydrothermale TaxID=981385 RepID=A0A7R6SYP1_9BACT|nr:NADH-quinone oxidoreductase subunit NuoH [Thermotomaculum hydrothermale]BBB32776.1 NADH-quinone oxidoreductase subunit H [Thermotomaculum hydrothermale]